MQRTLFVMVKEPRPGRVKTRLARDIGVIGAAHWYRRQTDTVLRRLRDPRWQLVLAVAPDRAGLLSRVWPADLPRVAQGPGNLGHRMKRLLQCAPPGPACVIGSDIPGIHRPHIAQAFDLLGHHDAVFGPACDGGYWLVGLHRRRAVPPGLFAGVRWSTRHALTDSIATLPDYRIGLAEQLQDVDTAADLLMTSTRGHATPAT